MCAFPVIYDMKPSRGGGGYLFHCSFAHNFKSPSTTTRMCRFVKNIYVSINSIYFKFMQQFPMRGSRNFLCQGGWGGVGGQDPLSTLPFPLCTNIWRICCEYSANCNVYSNFSLYIHFLSRIPSEQSFFLQKSDRWMFAVCHIIAAYSQQKLKLFSSTRYYSPGIRNKNLVLDTVHCIFVTVTLTFLCIRGVFI